MILIITNKEDVHPTPVIEYLNTRNRPVFRLNTESLLTDYEVNWWSNDNDIDFRIKNIRNGLEVLGSEITAVWERRPVPPAELKIHNHAEINKHNLGEANGFLSFLLYYISDKFSIGHHLYDRSAASKMLQLKIARELGANIPETCFSNRKTDIITFAKNHEYITLKPITADNLWLGGDDEYVFYSQKVKTSSLVEQMEEAFSQTISFVQNYIEKSFELRVTVVCDKCFACKIDSQVMDEQQGKIDWRQGYDHGLKHEIFDLPVSIQNFCKKFLSRMRLNFGCFDFIVTPRDQYVFLECNPNGQWLWIEQLTGMEISKAIAESLIKGNHKNISL